MSTIKEAEKAIIAGEDTGKWANAIDAVKFTTKVHSKLQRKFGIDIGEDFVLAKLDDNEQFYIKQMTKLAFGYKSIIPDKEIAHQTFNDMMLDVYMTVVMKRNIDRNTMLRIITGSKEEIEDEKEKELLSIAQKTAQQVGMGGRMP